MFKRWAELTDETRGELAECRDLEEALCVLAIGQWKERREVALELAVIAGLELEDGATEVERKEFLCHLALLTPSAKRIMAEKMSEPLRFNLR